MSPKVQFSLLISLLVSILGIHAKIRIDENFDDYSQSMMSYGDGTISNGGNLIGNLIDPLGLSGSTLIGHGVINLLNDEDILRLDGVIDILGLGPSIPLDIGLDNFLNVKKPPQDMSIVTKIVKGLNKRLAEQNVDALNKAIAAILQKDNGQRLLMKLVYIALDSNEIKLADYLLLDVMQHCSIGDLPKQYIELAQNTFSSKLVFGIDAAKRNITNYLEVRE